MSGHADVRVVGLSLGGSQQDQRRVQSGRLVRAADQFSTDPLALVRLVHGEIRLVGAGAEVADRTRYTNGYSSSSRSNTGNSTVM
jgi:hypothetical protein